MLRRFLLAAAILAIPVLLMAQIYPSIGPNTVLGRAGAGQQGQPQPISFQALANLLLQYFPTVATSSRTRLSGNTTVYVSKAGNDINNGLSAGTPWLTLQHAVSVVQNSFDLAGFSVTISVADAGSNYAPFAVTGPWFGGSSVTFQGDTGTPDNVVIDGAGGTSCAAAASGASFTITGFKLQNCAQEIQSADVFTTILFSNIDFGSPTAGGLGIWASRLSYAEVIGGGNLISGTGWSNFLQVSHQGNFRAAEVGTGALPFTLKTNITLSTGAFAYVASQGDITFTGYTASPFNLNGFTVTGQQWDADSNGMFQILNGSTGASMIPNFFPGSTNGACRGDCSVDQGAHVGTTVTGCGSGATIGGNDYYGLVTEGTSATGCTVTFASTFSGNPYCTFTWYTAAPSTVQAATSVSALGLTHGSASNAQFSYLCKGF